MSEIKTLEFKKLDLEPDEVPPIYVELGGDKYKAHCPNDYEFIALTVEVRKMEEDPTLIDMVPLLGAFFEPHEVKKIDRGCRTGKIAFVEELGPAMTALAEYFRPFVEKRLQQVQKKLTVPKVR